MKYLLPIFSLILLLFACKPKDPYQYEAATLIEMKKDPCFGFCPVYEVRIDGKGNAVFVGKRNVDKEGKWQ